MIRRRPPATVAPAQETAPAAAQLADRPKPPPSARRAARSSSPHQTACAATHPQPIPHDSATFPILSKSGQLSSGHAEFAEASRVDNYDRAVARTHARPFAALRVTPYLRPLPFPLR